MNFSEVQNRDDRFNFYIKTFYSNCLHLNLFTFYFVFIYFPLTSVTLWIAGSITQYLMCSYMNKDILMIQLSHQIDAIIYMRYTRPFLYITLNSGNHKHLHMNRTIERMNDCDFIPIFNRILVNRHVRAHSIHNTNFIFCIASYTHTTIYGWTLRVKLNKRNSKLFINFWKINTSLPCWIMEQKFRKSLLSVDEMYRFIEINQ